MIDVVLSFSLANKYRSQIEDVSPGDVRLLPCHGNDLFDPDYSTAEIAISGSFSGDRYAFLDIISSMPRLCWIHSTGAGIDDFVSNDLVERGIIVTSSSGIYAPAMVEYVIGMLVHVQRNLAGWLEGQRNHQWLPPDLYSGGELYGKRMGIIGFGGIGSRLSVVARALGMDVWVTNPRPPTSLFSESVSRFLYPSELSELLEFCDIIVVACPLNETTRGMIGEKEIRKMKKDAILINVARGPIVNEVALRNALLSGKISHAILDVTHIEPLPTDDPLWDTPNLMITSHISGWTEEGWQRSINLFCFNLKHYLAGRLEWIENLVDLNRHL